MTHTLTLPKGLGSASDRKALEDAVSATQTRTWPEGESRLEAIQPDLIADALIPKLHDELHGARIAYLFREKMTGRDTIILGKAKKAGADLVHLGNVDFVIEFNFEAWLSLVPNAKVALVDHELCHCGKDAESGAWVMVRHDVEEFAAIVKRWGLWTADLVTFGKVVGPQLEIWKGLDSQQAASS